MKAKEFFDLYFKYVAENTESPFVYHRWSMISTLSACVSRRVKIPMGHFNLYPNFYIQLIGNPGIRKSSAVKIPAKLLRETGFDRFAPNTCTKEALMYKLATYNEEITANDLIVTEDNPFEVNVGNDIADIFIVADEFNSFIGNNYEDFFELLSELWDCPPTYDKWLAKASAPQVKNPYINILSANTPSGFSNKFKGASLGQGILTRFIVVPWNDIRQKCAFPSMPDEELKAEIMEVLVSLKKMKATVKYGKKAYPLLVELYTNWKIPTPTHMEQYVNRRHTHLLKLCTLFACIEDQVNPTITEEIVLQANACLASNEKLMATTFRDIFESNDNVNARLLIMDALDKAEAGLKPDEVFQHVGSVVSSFNKVTTLLQVMQAQGLIFRSSTGVYMIKRQKKIEGMEKYLDLTFLTKEEVHEYLS